MRFFTRLCVLTRHPRILGFSIFFLLLLIVSVLAVSFSPSLLRSFASSVRREVSEEWASADDGPEAARPEMTAARVSERRLERQSSVLYPWRVPMARCKWRECPSFEVASINQFTIFISIDPYIPTSDILVGHAHFPGYDDQRRHQHLKLLAIGFLTLLTATAPSISHLLVVRGLMLHSI